MSKSIKLETRINPEIKVGDKVALIDLSWVTGLSGMVYSGVYDFVVTEIGIKDYVTSVFAHEVKLQDILMRHLPSGEFIRGCSKHVKVEPKFYSSMLEVGEMMRTHNGTVILKTYSNIVELGNPSSTWPHDTIIVGKKVKSGEKITLIAK